MPSPEFTCDRNKLPLPLLSPLSLFPRPDKARQAESSERRRSDRAKETIEKKSLLDRFSTGQRTDAQSFCFVQHLLLVSLSLQLLLDSFTMNIGFCRFPLLTTQYSGVDFCYIYGYNGGKSVYREESRL